MSSVFDVKLFWQVFVTLLVIMDPPGVVPPFLGLTKGLPARVRNRLAWQAAVVGLGVIVGFAVFGQSILAYLGVELPSLQAAGGLLLLLVALQLLTGSYTEPTEAERTRVNVAFVPLGTPLLAGPGAIVATMVFVQRAGTVGAVHGVRDRACGGHRPAVAYHAFLRGDSPAAAAQRRRTAHPDRRPAAVGHRRPAGGRRDPCFRNNGMTGRAA